MRPSETWMVLTAFLQRPFAADALRAIFKSDNNDNSKSNADDTTTHQREQEKEAFQVRPATALSAHSNVNRY